MLKLMASIILSDTQPRYPTITDKENVKNRLLRFLKNMLLACCPNFCLILACIFFFFRDFLFESNIFADYVYFNIHFGAWRVPKSSESQAVQVTNACNVRLSAVDNETTLHTILGRRNAILGRWHEKWSFQHHIRACVRL